VIDGIKGATIIQGPFMDAAAAQNNYDTNFAQSSKLNITSDGFVSSDRIEKHRILNLERGPISKDINGIILHRTVSTNTSSPLASFGLKGVGTHFLVGKDGKIFQTASLNFRTSHLRESQLKQGAPRNATSIGIEVVGMYYEDDELWDPLTEEQISSVTWLVNSLMDNYDLSTDNLFNHEDIQPKTKGEGMVVYDSIISGIHDGSDEENIDSDQGNKLFNFCWNEEQP
jgi:N-acetyl-anhydromuramyl-L-alanine amidase AmpD